ncbi:MAG: bifunctional phosphopantothenoylcysteine decarboxylase/phosphopantothenate--cysteine ligase CoaBC [Apilactobacillus sp.]|uniref:bifunctional phosphopantothenoylcysteine decarboxylase/phosphopantothenate--cysteine ligase CoaBC n=1 Tax=Apilactobacillus sp. TaxID=2767901 RepID=UPI0025F9C6CC|nr:bifunctional phosphopantothenoylcysteine decarboxylase/phosphopantothenate--cysteine ligase CoaBC [Apilactobacillus sp.]MCT6822357.1 bifunctional phosphopantothenoylcysteine decarboxylase/phosphopantothenate--cysteine ligase CoaBC [Apilactobacillus sp.]MCT6857699.1 bifunctional phosphopantothenoylcysteine decarboxylase/phosphopantothenate--cysteine ligase CoaBC [Apilactobacillus sp.]
MKNMKVALYVTGSIAAYKSLTLARLLVKNGADVRVVMSNGAQKFVTPLAFQTLTKNNVFVDTFDEPNPKEITHIDIATWADLSIVAPATANTIAKIANGIADDVVSTTLLATPTQKIVVPAMNNNMWDNLATQRNIKQLEDDGIDILYPTDGFLAEGYAAKGRMIEPEEIILQVQQIMKKSEVLAGKKILVTAGGTSEPIDPVRYITNRSSGKMGYAIAEACANAGAEVKLITASDMQVSNPNIEVERVITSNDMLDAVKNNFDSINVLIMAAAVSDYKSEVVSDQKIKKNGDYLEIRLKKTPDILKEVTKQKGNQFIVGFAAETQDLIANAIKKLETKKLDLLLANDVSNDNIGFSSDNNQISFIDKNGVFAKTNIESKASISSKLVKILSERLD